MLDALYLERATLYFRHTNGARSDAVTVARLERLENEMITVRARQFMASAVRRGDMLELSEAERRARLDLFGADVIPASSLWID